MSLRLSHRLSRLAEDEKRRMREDGAGDGGGSGRREREGRRMGVVIEADGKQRMRITQKNAIGRWRAGVGWIAVRLAQPTDKI